MARSPMILVAFLAGLTLSAVAEDADPAQVTIGERFFLETRFAQFFAANSSGDANGTLAMGDPAVANTVTLTGNVPGPFAGQSMNCRACHFVDELNGGMGNRTYCDFGRRSPIPDRGDGQTVTPRNSPPLVGANMLRPSGLLLHFDGEFSTGVDLVVGTFTGRNYGWLATERAEAIAHIAHVIREDNGQGDLAQAFGGLSYTVLLKGTSAGIPRELRLPVGFRLDVTHATDAQVVNAAARLVDAYMRSLKFSQSGPGVFNGSPYDAFLAKNKLPKAASANETNAAYGQRLAAALDHLASPKFVSDSDGAFSVHQQPFVFGATELEGLKLFLRQTPTAGAASAGNCVACHAPPTFTDFNFHNTGATQEEYDALHGAGAFARLEIPDFAERAANHEAFLPPTARHPYGSGRFRAVPTAADPRLTDLGLWNIFGNPDFPRSQAAIMKALTGGTAITPRGFLPRTVALFKTPSLRDLADAQPFLHNGSKDSLMDVLVFYQQTAQMARTGLIRNADPQMKKIKLRDSDLAPLNAFLTSLTEDYE